MVTCSVFDCCTTQRNNPEKCSFHRFPTNLDTRNAWIKLIDCSNWIPKKNSCLCSKHFEEKYLQTRGAKRILMKSAIPTKFIQVKIKPRRTVSSYAYRDIIPEASTCVPSSSDSRYIPPLLQQSTPSTSFQRELTPSKKKLISKCTKLHEKVKKKQQLIRNLRAQNKRTKNKVLTLTSLLDQIQKRPGLKDHLNDISAICCNKTIQALNDRANAVIRGDISQSATYCDELKTFTLMVHFYSPRSYSYIREEFSFCLPHVNTLRNWYKRVECAPGLRYETKLKSLSKLTLRNYLNKLSTTVNNSQQTGMSSLPSENYYFVLDHINRQSKNQNDFPNQYDE